MPSFKLLAPSFISRAAGEPVSMWPTSTIVHDFEGRPGANMQAMCDVGRSRVAIPRARDHLPGKLRIEIARSLGAAADVPIEDADRIIAAEVARREAERDAV